MYIFEGRGKGATWSLLLEALHNQGAVIVHNSTFSSQIKDSIIERMEREKRISPIGAEYLKNAVFSLDEWDREGKFNFRGAPVYLDNGLQLIQFLLRERLGTDKLDIIALGNDDEQIIDPLQIKERNNTFVNEQKIEDRLFTMRQRF